MPSRNLTATQASAILGVSAKALRLYERHGLIEAGRTRAGWRLYDEGAMARAAEVAALRGLGFSLGEIATLVAASGSDLDAALAAQEARLRERSRRVAVVLDRIRARAGREGLDGPPRGTGMASETLSVRFALPWPWSGDHFALDDLPRLGFITGPLGSGKTCFARALAAALPQAEFVGLDRGGGSAARQRMAGDTVLAAAVEARLARLGARGAQRSDALADLVAALVTASAPVLVIDMVEEGLDHATQAALMPHLRDDAGTGPRALLLMTRSAAILDLDALRPGEVVLLCPANHDRPMRVVPRPGGLGYEAAATCLASPAVRARSAGIIALRPSADRG